MEEQGATDSWIEFCGKNLASNDFKAIKESLSKINEHLKFKSFMSANKMTIADILVYVTLKNLPIWTRYQKEKKEKELGEDVARWYSHIDSLDEVKKASAELQQNYYKLKEKKKDQGSFEIGLDESWKGKVVTRFPPEPSGYLHIGHAKAALLNQYFAKQYDGKLIIRFDDTNPSKEKCEFEESILEDLELMGVKGDALTHTSDHFDLIYDYAIQMIKNGFAYCDDTPQEVMRDERLKGIESKRRNLSVEENLELFEEMRIASEKGQTYCLRAKMGMDNLNGAMRDPVIYRCNLLPHHRTGSKYKMYPTYDFACPIVDSIEGVTHALRTNEYHDRNPQYYWFIEKLGIRRPIIWDYSRLNFVYTLLSKRKLTWFVNENKVTGWDDPRFPTVRGIRRRGLTVQALQEYILMQGASQSTLNLEWDKLWSLNKRIIDPISPRYTALDSADLVEFKIIDGPAEACKKQVALHKKTPELGVKSVSYSANLLIEQNDAAEMEDNEEITMMDWGNMIVKKIVKQDGKVKSIEAILNLDGDFKKTKKKLTWLSNDASLIPIAFHDYDFLITKKKLEENDTFENCLTPVTEFITEGRGDENLKNVKKGDIIQIERKGYFICDRPFSTDAPMKLILIPDGKGKSIASKADQKK